MAEKRSFDLSDIPTIFNDELSGFHLGGTGIAGSIDNKQRCLGSVYILEGAEQAMLTLCGSANKAVRLYGLLGLKLVRSDLFQREYDKLANDPDEMFTWSGCMGYPSTVGRLANGIVKSDVQWLRDLNTPTKPAPPSQSRPRRHDQTPFSAFSTSDLPAELVHGGRNVAFGRSLRPDEIIPMPASDIRHELHARMQRPQRHRLLNGYPIAPLMIETPRPMRFIDVHDHDTRRPLIIGILPHSYCNPVMQGCGFCTFPHERFSASGARAAAQAVCREVTTTLEAVPNLRDRVVPAVYFGGGTANLGRTEDLAALMTTLGTSFQLGEAEVTLEGVPRYFTIRDHAMLTVLDQMACRQRRISMGVQTFDPDWLERMGRTAFGDAACIASLVTEAHRRDYTVSADLLYNLPSTGAELILRDLDTAMGMGFDQICVYNLVLSAGMHSAWASDAAMVAAMPTNERACETWLAVRSHLLGHGYVQRTLTNFERTDIASGARSFAYERLSFDPLHTDGIGFGPGAISTMAFRDGPTVKWTNVDTSAEYVKRVSQMPAVNSSVARHFVYEDADRQLLAMTRGFALTHVDGDAFATAFGTSLAEVAGDLFAVLGEQGLVEFGPPGHQGYSLTPRGMFFADAVVGFLSHRRLAAMSAASRDAMSYHGHM